LIVEERSTGTGFLQFLYSFIRLEKSFGFSLESLDLSFRAALLLSSSIRPTFDMSAPFIPTVCTALQQLAQAISPDVLTETSEKES